MYQESLALLDFLAPLVALALLVVQVVQVQNFHLKQGG